MATSQEILPSSISICAKLDMVNIGSAVIQSDQLPCVSIHRIGAGGGEGGLRQFRYGCANQYFETKSNHIIEKIANSYS